jgi:hypothetical protein
MIDKQNPQLVTSLILGVEPSQEELQRAEVQSEMKGLGFCRTLRESMIVTEVLLETMKSLLKPTPTKDQ